MKIILQYYAGTRSLYIQEGRQDKGRKTAPPRRCSGTQSCPNATSGPSCPCATSGPSSPDATSGPSSPDAHYSDKKQEPVEMGELLADGRCGQTVLHFLATADVGKLSPPEGPVGREAPESEYWEREKEWRAEADGPRCWAGTTAVTLVRILFHIVRESACTYMILFYITPHYLVVKIKNLFWIRKNKPRVQEKVLLFAIKTHSDIWNMPSESRP